MEEKNKNRSKRNSKRIRVLFRRLQNQNDVIKSLEERNMHLVSELKNSKISLATLSDDYNKLLTMNFEHLFMLNHLGAVNSKLKAVLENVDTNVIAALNSLGNSSEMLLNLKNHIDNANTIVEECNTTSPPQKRFQEPTNPLLNEYFSRNSIEMLKRKSMSPFEMYTLRKGIVENMNLKYNLSPIPEEYQQQHQIKSCLGSRGLNSFRNSQGSFGLNNSRKIVDSAQTCYDGLNNLSCLSENEQSKDVNPTLRSLSPSFFPFEHTSPIVVSEQLEVPTSYVTISKRRRKKIKEVRDSSLENSENDEKLIKHSMEIQQRSSINCCISESSISFTTTAMFTHGSCSTEDSEIAINNRQNLGDDNTLGEYSRNNFSGSGSVCLSNEKSKKSGIKKSMTKNNSLDANCDEPVTPDEGKACIKLTSTQKVAEKSSTALVQQLKVVNGSNKSLTENSIHLIDKILPIRRSSRKKKSNIQFMTDEQWKKVEKKLRNKKRKKN